MKKTGQGHLTDSRRKDAVLGIVVNEYIKSVTPVSSGYIVKEYLLDLSSATVRNILAELEKEGYLMHPHTSAGRVPTEEGYRYYVDNLMHEINLLEEEKRRIQEEYRQGLRDLEAILEKTSEVASNLTHYTSIVAVDDIPDKIFCRGRSYLVEYTEPQEILKIRHILEALERKEHILEIINRNLERKIEIFIGHELAAFSIESCSMAISRFATKSGSRGRIAVLGPTRMDYQRVVSTLEYLSNVIEGILIRH